ncbi:MAG: RDD family protein [Candidatus Lokiarchaeota archaeon]|nr:RDD family protein [Candidatus Lokiarchaeota archaeon]
MSLKFCPKCGNELESGSSFCDSCGADLGTKTETPAAISPGVTTTQEPKVKPETVYYPDFLKRVIALIFDSIIIGLIGSAFTWILINPSFPVNFFDPFGRWWFTFPFDWLIGFLYHWGMEAHNNGQTLGKMALNLRTVDEKTLGQASSSNLALNNLFKSSPFLILDVIIGMVKNSGDPKKRYRIMQNVSETVVIFSK